MESIGTPVRHPMPKPIAIAVLIWILLGLLPVYPRMCGYRFLPSYKWMSIASVVGQASGLVLAVAFICAVWRDRDNLSGSTLKKTGVIIAAPFFGFFTGQSVMLIAPPMIAALVAGHHVETSFTIARANELGASGCYSSVELRDLPYFFNQVCLVGSSSKRSVPQGTEVKVIGHGTELGLFVEDVRLASEIGIGNAR